MLPVGPTEHNEYKRMSIFNDFRTAARGNAAPATTGLIVAMIGCAVLIWMKIGSQFFNDFIFVNSLALAHPWSFLTYPFFTSASNTVGLLFLCLWLWGIGGSVERDLGSVKYLLVFFAFTALCALGLLIGGKVLNIEGSMAGGWTAVAAITIMWGTRNPNQTVLLMFVIPIQGKWIAWLAGVIVFFGTVPQLAPFAVAPLILAYYFAANRLPFAPYSKSDLKFTGAAKTTERYNRAYYDEVRKREKEREERERLRKLFEGSLGDDPKE